MGGGSKSSKTSKIDSKKRELQLVVLRKSYYSQGGNAVFPRWEYAEILRKSYYSQGGNAVFPRWEHAEILRKTFGNLGTFRQKSPRKVAEVAVISCRSCRDFLKKLP